MPTTDTPLARALAWARGIPPQTGTAWQSVALAEMGVAAWEHVPAIVAALDAQADALVDARVQVELLRGAACPRCAGEGE